jgi:imidazolonepropionase-like amidohydrolase
MTKARPFLLATLCAVAPAATAQNVVTIPRPVEPGPVVITGATIHPVSRAPIADGRIRFEAGKITAVGGAEVPTAGARVIEARGQHVYPGLINANTVVGLVEVSAARATVDTAEVGPVNPNARAAIALNPDSEMIPVTRANGVLVALAVPQPGATGVVTGQSALVGLDGWTWEELTIKTPVGMHIHWPSLLVPEFLPAPLIEQVRKAQRDKRDALAAAMRDAKAWREAARGGTVRQPDLRWQAMQPMLDGSLPVYIHADDLESIQSALAFAAEHGLRMVLVGGLEAWRLAPLLAARRVPVIVGGVHRLPLRRSDPFDAVFANASRLAQAGVPFAIATQTDDFTWNARNLPYHAATAAAYGLDRALALRAITLSAAEILGVADRLGSLEVGKDATLFVTTGDPLDIRTDPTMAFIGGREVDLRSRHTMLNEKYLRRLEQTGKIAPAAR